MKKVISLLLSITMLMTSILCVDLSAFANDLNITNRAEWLSKLVETFDMTVESDNYPENYFSDLTEESQYYRDVLVATEFGLVDVEAGDPVNPDSDITREFAAQTLNFCLGFTVDENGEQVENYKYTFLDYQECLYPDDDQVAVNRGWFELDEKDNFCPDNIVTAEEILIMIEDAESTIKSDEIDDNYDSTYEITKGVVEIPNGTEIEIDENYNVIIYDKSYNISVGDTFIVYSYDIPVVYDAKAVTENEDNIFIETENGSVNDALESIDIQEVVEADVSEFIPSNGYEIVEDTEELSTFSLFSLRKPNANNSISLEKKIDLIAGNSITLKVKISDINLGHKINVSEGVAEVKLTFNVSFYADGQFNFDEINKDDLDSFSDLGKMRFAGIGFVEFKPQLNFNGKFSYNQKFSATIGFSKDSSGFHNLASFKKDVFTITLEASSKFGIRVALGVEILIVKANIHAEIGVKSCANTESSTDSSNSLTYCITLSAYLYFTTGIEAEIDFVVAKSKWKYEYEVFKDTNSPVRLYFHFENGVEVDGCTVGSKTKPKYVTPSTSKYGSVYTDNIGNLTGVVNSGDFSLSINSNNTATIIGYKGTSSVVNIPNYINGHKVISIGEYAFYGCESLTSVKIPDSVISIGDYAFSGCKSLTSVKIPDSVISIGDGAFAPIVINNGSLVGCINLTSITIPNSVISIGDHAFICCTGLTNITIPESVTSIGYHAFYYCTSLINITVNNDNHSYSSQDGVLFNTDKSSLIQYPLGKTSTSYNIPNSVTNIDDGAFAGCTSLTSITIPNSVSSIGDWAFANCTSLTSITIPNSVTSIGSSAFENCTSLTSVTISKDVTSIGDEAFLGCTSLTGINVDNNNTSYSSQDGVLFNKNKTMLIQYPNGNTRTSYTIPNSVTGICRAAFYNSSNLTSATIPDTVTSMDNFAFESCKNLKSVKIGKGLKEIPYGAFQYCTNLKSVTISDGVESIGGGAFCSCESLTDITIPDSVISIEDNAFDGCNNLKDVYYAGSKSQWDNINLDPNDNNCLINATIHYNYKPHTHTYKTTVTKATTSKNGSIVTKCTCGAVKSKSTIYYPKKISLSTTSYTYDGKVKKPSVKVVGSNGKTISSSNYTVSYASGRKNVGKYSVKITFKGNYSGSKTLYFTIKPKSTSISKLTASKKAFTVKWKKQSTQVTGYQIQYSTSSKFKSTKTVTVSKNSTTSKKISKLKAKKKYYVRIRNYKTVKGTKYYSAWSKAKSVTTKK